MKHFALSALQALGCVALVAGVCLGIDLLLGMSDNDQYFMTDLRSQWKLITIVGVCAFLVLTALLQFVRDPEQ